MPENAEQQLASLLQLNKPSLVELWQQLFKKRPCSQLRRSFMIPILTYKIQEQVSGPLRPEIHRRLQQLLCLLDAASDSPTLPAIKPGTRLVREWRGQGHVVEVKEQGYEYRGDYYASLSEIARRITGTRWSGPLFFGIKRNHVANRKALHEIRA